MTKINSSLTINGNSNLPALTVNDNSGYSSFFGGNVDIQGTMSSDYISSANATVTNLRVTSYSGQSGSVLTSIDTNGNVQWKTLQELNPYGLTSSGSKTNNKIPKWSSEYGLTNSSIIDYGTHIYTDSPMNFKNKVFINGASPFTSHGIYVQDSYSSFSTASFNGDVTMNGDITVSESVGITGTVSIGGSYPGYKFVQRSGSSFFGGNVDIQGTMYSDYISSPDASVTNLRISNYSGISGSVLTSSDTIGNVQWRTTNDLNLLTGSTNFFGPNQYSIPMFSGGAHILANSPLLYNYQQGYVWSNATFSTSYIVVDQLKISQYNSQNGYYLKSDSSGNATWAPLPGGLTGSGTNNFIPRWNNSASLTNSIIYDNGNTISIGLTNNSGFKLEIKGDSSYPGVYIHGTDSWGPGQNISSDIYMHTYWTEFTNIGFDTTSQFILDAVGSAYGNYNRLSYSNPYVGGSSLTNTLSYIGFDSYDIYGTSSSLQLELQGLSYYSNNYKNVEWSSNWRFINDPLSPKTTDFVIEGTNSTNFFVSGASNSVGIGTNTPDNSSILDLSSTTKGFLPPRMTATEAELISSPAEGLMIYSTDGSGSNITSKGWWGWNGITWEKLN